MSNKKFAILLFYAALFFNLLAVGSCVRGNGNLRVSVQNTDGSPIIGAKVVSESQPAGQLKITGITSVENGGVVTFNDIKPGKYQIQVSHYSHEPENLDVTVPAGKTKDVVVKLFFVSPPPVI